MHMVAIYNTLGHFRNLPLEVSLNLPWMLIAMVLRPDVEEKTLSRRSSLLPEYMECQGNSIVNLLKKLYFLHGDATLSSPYQVVCW